MKDGIKTTEFYLTLASVVGLFVLSLALALTNQTDKIAEVLQTVGLAVAGLVGSYNLGRSYVKSKIG